MSDISVRIGQGFDVHPLVEGRPLVLGGVKIQHRLGLKGHSDADVLCHAIGDALLGAANLGDLGAHFPDTDPQFKGISSVSLLHHIQELIEKADYKIINIDATLLAEQPKIAPYRSAMQANIAAALRVNENQIGIKATTCERLGFVGRFEGMAAMAVALISARSPLKKV